tara:strand:- start:8505 stop:9032 length:528 start_codon:yes stop_codon:yes gene_type:complete
MALFSLANGSQPFARFLDKTGKGTGDTNMNEDYSGGGGQEFKLTPDAGQVVRIERLIITIMDGTIVADQYGGIGGALSNGVNVFLRNGAGETFDMLNGEAIKMNGQWPGVTHDYSLGDYGSPTNKFIAFRWAFENHFGAPVMLRGDLGEELVFKFEDDVSGLIMHRVMADGSLRS